MVKSRSHDNSVLRLFFLIYFILLGNIFNFTLKATQNDELVQQEKVNLLQDNQYLLGPGDILELSLFDS